MKVCPTSKSLNFGFLLYHISIFEDLKKSNEKKVNELLHTFSKQFSAVSLGGFNWLEQTDEYAEIT